MDTGEQLEENPRPSELTKREIRELDEVVNYADPGQGPELERMWLLRRRKRLEAKQRAFGETSLKSLSN